VAAGGQIPYNGIPDDGKIHVETEKKQLTLTCAVDSYRSGWTIVEFLAHRFKYHSAEGWERRVREHWVRVNGAAVAPDFRVTRDDAVDYTIWHAEPAVDERYDVLYEDPWLLAVGKSGNIPVHSCGVYITHTLINRLKKDYGDTLNLAHRLDRETSGAVVLARDRETNRRIAGMFSRGEVNKRYIAVVFGDVPEDRFEVDAPIGKMDQRDRFPEEYAWGKAHNLATYLPKRCIDHKDGKPARTRFEVLCRRDGFTTLRVTPLQGRTNQIRVHLAHAGYPIVGDKIYALAGELRDEILRQGLTQRVRDALVLPRHALHCASMQFNHPRTGERLVIGAPLPADLQKFTPLDPTGENITT
jgi:23S rRNA pseudouridine1911/1915/1917 synthase